MTSAETIERAPLVVATPAAPQCVWFAAPLPAGFTLDSQAAVVSGYDAVQAALVERLPPHVDGQGAWCVPARSDFNVDSYAGKPVVPYWLVERKLHRLFGLGSEASDHPTVIRRAGFEWHLVRADVKVFDFGIAVSTAGWTVRPDVDVDEVTYRREVERFSEVVGELLGPTVARTLADVRAALENQSVTVGPPDNRQVYQLLRDEPFATTSATIGDATRPMWTHRLYGVQLDPDVDTSQALRAGMRLLPPYPEDRLRPIETDAFGYLPGNGSSVALCRDPADIRPLLHAIELQEAFWAGCARLDRLLLERLVAFAVTSRTSDLDQLDASFQEVFSLFERVRFFRSTLRSLIPVLSPLQRACWLSLADAWQLDAQVEAVDDKLDTLQRMHDDLSAAASARRTSRLNNAVFVFTVFSLTQTVLGIIAFGFTRDGQVIGFSSDRWAELLIILTLIAASLVLILLLYARRERVRR